MSEIAKNTRDPRNGLTPRIVTGIWIPVTLLLALIVIELAVSLGLNNGKLVYSLDDPYIHLALAENIFNGHYGVNTLENSAPSSSPIWPFLLAPFSFLSFFEYVPLIINLLASLLTLFFIHWTVRIVIQPKSNQKRNVVSAILICIPIPITNLVRLIFTGNLFDYI